MKTSSVYKLARGAVAIAVAAGTVLAHFGTVAVAHVSAFCAQHFLLVAVLVLELVGAGLGLLAGWPFHHPAGLLVWAAIGAGVSFVVFIVWLFRALASAHYQ